MKTPVSALMFWWFLKKNWTTGMERGRHRAGSGDLGSSPCSALPPWVALCETV